jgi:hypothetical protein
MLSVVPSHPARRWSDRLDDVVSALLPPPAAPGGVLDARGYDDLSRARALRARRTGARVVALRLAGGPDGAGSAGSADLAARVRAAVRAGDVVAVVDDGSVAVLVEDQWLDGEAVARRLAALAPAGHVGAVGRAG